MAQVEASRRAAVAAAPRKSHYDEEELTNYDDDCEGAAWYAAAAEAADAADEEEEDFEEGEDCEDVGDEGAEVVQIEDAEVLAATAAPEQLAAGSSGPEPPQHEAGSPEFEAAAPDDPYAVVSPGFAEAAEDPYLTPLIIASVEVDPYSLGSPAMGSPAPVSPMVPSPLSPMPVGMLADGRRKRRRGDWPDQGPGALGPPQKLQMVQGASPFSPQVLSPAAAPLSPHGQSPLSPQVFLSPPAPVSPLHQVLQTPGVTQASPPAPLSPQAPWAPLSPLQPMQVSSATSPPAPMSPHVPPAALWSPHVPQAPLSPHPPAMALSPQDPLFTPLVPPSPLAPSPFLVQASDPPALSVLAAQWTDDHVFAPAVASQLPAVVAPPPAPPMPDLKPMIKGEPVLIEDQDQFQTEFGTEGGPLTEVDDMVTEDIDNIDADRSWDERCVVVRQGQVHIELQHQSPPMNDEILLRFCDWLDQKMPLVVQNFPYVRKSGSYIDISDNNIGQEGLDKLFRVLRDHRVPCLVLKAYRNNIDDSIVDTLIEYLYTQPEDFPMHGIHISHNKLSDKGAFRLIKAASLCGHYPRFTSRLPLWLRLECNSIENPQRIVMDCNKENFNVCLMRDGLCSRPKCNHYLGVHVQLPYFFHQYGRQEQQPPPMAIPPPQIVPPRWPKPADGEVTGAKEPSSEAGAGETEEEAADSARQQAEKALLEALEPTPDWMRQVTVQGVPAPRRQAVSSERCAIPRPPPVPPPVRGLAPPAWPPPPPQHFAPPTSRPPAEEQGLYPGAQGKARGPPPGAPALWVPPPACGAPPWYGKGGGKADGWRNCGGKGWPGGGGGWKGDGKGGGRGGGGGGSWKKQLWSGPSLMLKVKHDVKLADSETLGFTWMYAGNGKSPKLTGVVPESPAGHATCVGQSLLRINGLDAAMFNEKQITDMLKQRPVTLRFGDE